jgi:hypothetical protein
LEGAKAAFDFTLGLGAGGDQMGDAQRGEGALELGAGIAALGGGIMAKQGQAVGVKRQRQALAGKAAAEVLEMVPSGVGGDKGARHEFAGVIVHRQQEGLLVRRRPPLVNGGVVLPQLTQPGAFPAAAGLGSDRSCLHQLWKVLAGIGGDGFAVALEGKAGSQFVGHELIVGRSLEGQEGLQKRLHFGRPEFAVVATGALDRERVGMLQPGRTQSKEMRATDVQELGGSIRIEFAPVESGERLEQERQGQTFGQLMFCKQPLSPAKPRKARLFVGLRYAPASSKPGLAGSFTPKSHFVPPSVSFCSRPNTIK